MSSFMGNISFDTQGEGDIKDVTGQVQTILDDSDIQNGLVCVFNPGSTGAVTTIEYEPGLLVDLSVALEKLVPKGVGYRHDARWHDGNGHSHVRASILGPSLTLPFQNGRLLLGTWQQIVFVELDVRKRTRNLLVQVLGDK